MYIVKPRLSEILKEKRMTQTRLAELSGIPQAAISRFDKAENHKDAHLVCLSRALGIPIEELFHIEKKDTK